MFTLRIIFYGLIALAPDPGEEVLTGLLIDHVNHDARVFVTEGICAGGECQRNSLPPNEQKFNLIWELDREHLTFDLPAADDWEVVSGLVTPDDDGVYPSFPADLSESRDVHWIPTLGKIVADAGHFAADCFAPEPQSCPVAARVELQRGSWSACHLVHGEDPANDDGIDGVWAFDFRPHGANKPTVEPPRAIADAALVEIQVDGSKVTLRSLGLGAQPETAWAELEPEGGRITVIVSNNDFSSAGSHRHFEGYYGLTKAAGNLQTKPIPYPREKQLTAPKGSCETDLDSFEETLGVGVDGVHNHRECDLVQGDPP